MMGSIEIDLPTKRIFLVDAPRTCSQLFNKIFQEHPQLVQIFHPMICAMYGSDRINLDFKHCEEADQAGKELARLVGIDDTYAVGAAKLELQITDVEKQGKIAWVKDHTCCHIERSLTLQIIKTPFPLPTTPVILNPTTFSDTLFESFTPIILIRHPLLVLRSYYLNQHPVFRLEPTDEDFKFGTTLQFSKLLFDAKREATGQIPIVVDAEDVVYDTERTVSRLCKRLGIAEDGVQFSWSPVPMDQRPKDPIMQGFFKDILDSSGIMRAEKPAEKTLDVDETLERWKSEFGQDTGSTLGKRVRDEMPIYEYLRSFRTMSMSE